LYKNVAKEVTDEQEKQNKFYFIHEELMKKKIFVIELNLAYSAISKFFTVFISISSGVISTVP
jgi:hypothetical protein